MKTVANRHDSLLGHVGGRIRRRRPRARGLLGMRLVAACSRALRARA